MPTHQRISQRHLARQVALQATYWHYSQPLDDLAEVVETLGKDRKLATKGRRHALLLCRQAEANRHTYEQELASVSQNWESDRVGRIEHIIIALALTEWDMAEEDTPPKVVLDEAVILAREFCGDASGTFVNGVLDALGHRKGFLKSDGA